MRVEVHEQHFAPDAADADWMRAATERGWLILTKDKRVRRRPGELQTIRDAGAAAFILTAGDLPGSDQAAAFLGARTRIEQLARNYSRPLIATISAAGIVTLIEGERRGGRRKE